MMRRALVVLSIGFLWFLGGCGGPTDPGDPKVGSLQVVIAGLPDGVNASVSVTGPGGFAQDLFAGRTLTGLTPGEYTTAASEVSTTALRRYPPSITGSPATVVAGATARVTVNYTLTPGSLQVDVTGLPGDVDADLVVTGPNGFSRTLSGDALLGGVEPGTYTVSAAGVRSDDPTASALFDPPAAVEVEVDSAGTAEATIPYSRRPASGRLWIPGAGDVAILGFRADQLVAGGSPSADPGVTDAASGGVEAVAFDAAGNAWVAGFSSHAVFRYDVADLAAGGPVTPGLVLTGSTTTELAGSVGLAFDDGGGLWVIGFSSRTLVRFSAAQLAAGGAQTPAVVLSVPDASIVAIAFDAAGTLWAVEQSVKAVYGFTPDQQASSATVTPAVTIGTNTVSLNNARDLAFDASGNLWVASRGSDRLERFTPGQLAASGTPTPSVTVQLTGVDAQDQPEGLAFDNSGNLWVLTNVGSVLRFRAAQLATSGSPTPNPILTGLTSFDLPHAAFYPTPEGLPIRAP